MEVADCKVYDERREQSERIMKDTEQRREKVVEVVGYLADLDDETEELQESQTLDRDKRALERTIHDANIIPTESSVSVGEPAEFAECMDIVALMSQLKDLIELRTTGVIDNDGFTLLKAAYLDDADLDVAQLGVVEAGIKEFDSQRELMRLVDGSSSTSAAEPTTAKLADIKPLRRRRFADKEWIEEREALLNRLKGKQSSSHPDHPGLILNNPSPILTLAVSQSAPSHLRSKVSGWTL
jgi:hypothetical protein